MFKYFACNYVAKSCLLKTHNMPANPTLKFLKTNLKFTKTLMLPSNPTFFLSSFLLTVLQNPMIISRSSSSSLLEYDPVDHIPLLIALFLALSTLSPGFLFLINQLFQSHLLICPELRPFKHLFVFFMCIPRSGIAVSLRYISF